MKIKPYKSIITRTPLSSFNLQQILTQKHHNNMINYSSCQIRESYIKRHSRTPAVGRQSVEKGKLIVLHGSSVMYSWTHNYYYFHQWHLLLILELEQEDTQTNIPNTCVFSLKVEYTSIYNGVFILKDHTNRREISKDAFSIADAMRVILPYIIMITYDRFLHS